MKIAFMFPGQGAQYIGMGKDLYIHYKSVRDIFDETDEILQENFVDTVFNGNDDEIKRTENTQPAILMVSTAIAQLLIDMGFNPIIAAGLSLGEYSALVTAKSFTYRDAIPLVRKRGIIMSSSVPAGKGAMSAVIGLEEERLLACCEEAEKYGMVSIANYNCPGQMVISGETEAVNIASQLAKKAGAKRVVPLSVSGPFHSLLLKPASYALAEELKNVNINPPVIPVISNVTAKPVTTSEEIRSLLIKQVYSPVRWEDSVRYMISIGVNVFLELGPGKALTGFIRRIDNSIRAYNVEDLNTLERISENILSGKE